MNSPELEPQAEGLGVDEEGLDKHSRAIKVENGFKHGRAAAKEVAGPICCAGGLEVLEKAVVQQGPWMPFDSGRSHVESLSTNIQVYDRVCIRLQKGVAVLGSGWGCELQIRPLDRWAIVHSVVRLWFFLLLNLIFLLKSNPF